MSKPLLLANLSVRLFAGTFRTTLSRASLVSTTLHYGGEAQARQFRFGHQHISDSSSMRDAFSVVPYL